MRLVLAGTSKQLLPGSPIESELYDGALFLSHGEKDDVWSVNRTKRLEKRLRDAGRRPEVHYYPEQTHRLTPEGRKVHQTRLVAFFRDTSEPRDDAVRQGGGAPGGGGSRPPPPPAAA